VGGSGSARVAETRSTHPPNLEREDVFAALCCEDRLQR